jgi:DNA polymerase-4
VVTLKVRLQPFETHTRSRTLPAATADDLLVFRTAWKQLQAEPWAGRRGIMQQLHTALGSAGYT